MINSNRIIGIFSVLANLSRWANDPMPEHCPLAPDITPDVSGWWIRVYRTIL